MTFNIQKSVLKWAYLEGYKSEEIVREVAYCYGFSDPVFENGRAVFKNEQIKKWHGPWVKRWFAMWRRVR